MAVNCGRLVLLPLIFVYRIILILILLFCAVPMSGQDSVHNNQDSLTSDDIVFDSSRAIAPVANLSTPRKYGRLRAQQSKTVRFFIGLSTFLLLGILRFLYIRHIKELFEILSRSTLGRMTSKEAIWQNLMPRWLFLLIYFSAAGFIVGQLILRFSNFSVNSLTLWIVGISIIFSGFLFKFLAIHAVGLVFRFNKTAVSFFYHLSVVNQLLGLILLPICGILMLAPPQLANFLLIVSVILLSISLIFKMLINIGYVRNMPRVNYLHFILYLCTLEFIPLAVCARYVYNSIGA